MPYLESMDPLETILSALIHLKSQYCVGNTYLMDHIEKTLMVTILERFKGDVSKSAVFMQMDRKVFYRKMTTHEIPRGTGKPK